MHYPHHGAELVKIHSLYARLKAELEEHFAKEEREVFPQLIGNRHPDEGQRTLVDSLIHEHSSAGDMIKELEVLTNNFTAPADGCATYRATFAGLQELTQDIFIHIFKENSILFPEILEQE